MCTVRILLANTNDADLVKGKIPTVNLTKRGSLVTGATVNSMDKDFSSYTLLHVNVKYRSIILHDQLR
jgi:hypothetical protein